MGDVFVRSAEVLGVPGGAVRGNGLLAVKPVAGASSIRDPFGPGLHLMDLIEEGGVEIKVSTLLQLFARVELIVDAQASSIEPDVFALIVRAFLEVYDAQTDVNFLAMLICKVQVGVRDG